MSEQVAPSSAPQVEQPGPTPTPGESVAEDGTGERARDDGDGQEAGSGDEPDTDGSDTADQDRPEGPAADPDRPAESAADPDRPEGPAAETAQPEESADQERPEGPAADPDRPAESAADPARPAGAGIGVVKVLGVVAVVVALLVVAGLKLGAGAAVGRLLNPDRVGAAKAGDCLTELPEVTGAEARSVRDVEVVTCSSGDAKYTVAGRVDGQTEAQARSGKACERYLTPDQDAYLFYRVEPGRTGYLLCLTRKA